MRVYLYQYLTDILQEQQALVAQVAASLEKAEGNSTGIDYNKPPKNFADTMSRMQWSGWEHTRRSIKGSAIDCCEIVIPQRGANPAKVLGFTACTDYKVEQGVLQKRKVRLFAREDQQAYGIDDTLSPALKATEVRSMTAIAAEHGGNMYKTDT